MSSEQSIRQPTQCSMHGDVKCGMFCQMTITALMTSIHIMKSFILLCHLWQCP